MRFEKEAEVDQKIAALDEDALRRALKTAIAMIAMLLHNQKQLDGFLKSLAAEFNKAGEHFGREYQTRVADHLSMLDAILSPPSHLQ